jgi:excisionase family DNA binding protein
MLVEEVYLDSARIVGEARERALKLGLVELYTKSIPLNGLADPLNVKAFLAECIRTCLAPTTDDDLLKVTNAAGRLNTSPRTVYRLCEKGELPHLHVGSGRGTIRIRSEDLAAFMRKAIETMNPTKRVTLEQLRAI